MRQVPVATVPMRILPVRVVAVVRVEMAGSVDVCHRVAEIPLKIEASS